MWRVNWRKKKVRFLLVFWWIWRQVGDNFKCLSFRGVYFWRNALFIGICGWFFLYGKKFKIETKTPKKHLQNRYYWLKMVLLGCIFEGKIRLKKQEKVIFVVKKSVQNEKDKFGQKFFFGGIRVSQTFTFFINLS